MSSVTADDASAIANEIHTNNGDGHPVTLLGIISSRWFLYCLSTLLFLAVWYWVVSLNILGRGLCYPHEVISAIGDLATRKLAGATLWEHIWASGRRVLLGFSLAVIGRSAPKWCVSRWLKTFRKKGKAGLREDGRKGSYPRGRPKGIKHLPDKEKIRYLEAQIAYLKAENSFLANLRKKS